MIRIKITASPSEINSKSFIFEPANNGLTDKEWNELSNPEKHDQLMQFLESIPDQPYWSLDGFEEK